MKAIFKLTNYQIAAAKAATDAAYGGLNCGIYCADNHCAVNTNQSVQLVNNTLVVEGERCALAFDGGYIAAKKILTPGQKPVEYQTSDKRLKWDETLEKYMFSDRATRAEKMDYLEAHGGRWLASRLFPDLWGAVERVSHNYRAASAELDADTASACRRIAYLIQ